MANIPYLLGKDVPMDPSAAVPSFNPDTLSNALDKSAGELNQAAIIRARQERMEALQDTIARKNQFDKGVMNLMYGDGTPDNPGLLSLKGANARGADKTFEGGIDALKQQAMNGVNNPYAARELGNQMNTAELTHLQALKEHMARESMAYSGELANTTNALGTENIARAPADEDLFQQNLAQKIQSKTTAARLAGAKDGDPMIQDAIQSATGEAVSARLKTMFDNPSPAVQATAYKLWTDRFSKVGMDYKNYQAMDDLAKKFAPMAVAMDGFHDYSQHHFAGSDPEDIIRFVQGTAPGTGLEGGSKTVTDVNGYKAQFGLNKQWNDDLDIGNLTSDQAVAAAKARYWDKNKIGDLPPAMQAAAFDTYYLMPPKQAALLIEEAGNNPQRLLALREARFKELHDQDPDKYNDDVLNSWMRRNRALGAKMEDHPMNVMDAQDYSKSLPPAAQEKFMSLVENHNAQFAAQHDQAIKATMDAGLDFIMKNGKGYDAMPLSMQDQIDKLGMTQQFKDYKNRADSDPSAVTALNAMDPAKFVKEDLNVPGVRLMLTPQEYARYRQKQENIQQNPQALDTQQQRFAMMKKAFQVRGINLREKFDPQDPTKVTYDGNQEFNRANLYVDEEIDAYTSKNKAYPTTTELQKMVDNVFTKVVTAPSNHWWTSDTTANKYDDIKVPVDERQKIVDALHKSGRSPTDDLIKFMYIESLKPAPVK